VAPGNRNEVVLLTPAIKNLKKIAKTILRTTQKFKIAYNHRCSPIKYKEINANII